MSIYGDSYGTYFAQAFAVRHPERVRAVVLDAAFAVDGFDPWGRTTTDAIRAAWTLLCARSACPGGDPLAAIRDLAVRLERTPLTGRARDADGAAQRVRLDGAAFGQLVNDAGYGYAIYRDLLAAGRAYAAGDPAPLLRLAAEDLTSVEAGAPASYSEGAYAAVACHDYPTIWNPASSPAARRAELRRRAARSSRPTRSRRSRRTCGSTRSTSTSSSSAAWSGPRPPCPTRRRPPGAPYPAVPVLVLNGDLDVITPLSDAARATALFPRGHAGRRRATRSTSPRSRTSTAARPGSSAASCARSPPGDTSCAAPARRAARRPALPAPRRGRAADGGAARRATASRPLDRRAAWAAAQAVADALSRWWLISGSRGHGLRGGRFTATGAYYSYGPVRFRLRAPAVRRGRRGQRPRDVGAARAAGPRAGADRRRAPRHAADRLDGRTGRARARDDQRPPRRPHGAAADAGALSARRRTDRRRRATARAAGRPPSAGAAWTPARWRAARGAGRRPSRPPTRPARARAAARSASRGRRARGRAGRTRGSPARGSCAKRTPLRAR